MLPKILNTFFGYKIEMVDPKNPFLSKTLWVNLLAIFCMFLSKKYKIELDTQDQVAILGAINILLRFITKKQIGFYEDTTGKNKDIQNS
jgi:hypothetical protein